MSGANILLQPKKSSFLGASETSASGHNGVVESIKQSKAGVLDTEEGYQKSSGIL